MRHLCKHCGREVFMFDKPPAWSDGWATDDSGDVVDDFICPARESTGRYPDGKPHEVTDMTWHAWTVTS